MSLATPDPDRTPGEAETFTVRIVACSKRGYWYADHTQETYTVRRASYGGYIVIDPNVNWWIASQDAEIV